MQENRWHNAWESWSASWSILFHNFHLMLHSPYVFLFPDFFIFKHFDKCRQGRQGRQGRQWASNTV